MRKELLAWKSPVQLAKLISNAKPPDTMPWRPPVPGDQVAISGMRRRPELNGARAEVLGNEADEFGRRPRVRWHAGPQDEGPAFQAAADGATGPSASAAAGSAGRAGAQQAARSASLLSGAGRSALSAAAPSGVQSAATRHLPGGILSASASAPQL
ncbi:unnamed protein product [Prorocentrum cordatum]|uniref:Uncharacterized protein n=1 Tax=Prorocentrum cordatum TaxID=2364126 RepID=A0ABN9UQQ7_9DINO|nr:unnamed protein product [Polarella glacialis]